MTAPQNELDETQPVAEPGMGLGDLSWRGVGRRERDLKLLVVMAKYKSEALGTGTVGTKCRTYSMVNLSAFSSDPAVRKYTNVFRRSVYTSNLPDFVHKIENSPPPLRLRHFFPYLSYSLNGTCNDFLSTFYGISRPLSCKDR